MTTNTAPNPRPQYTDANGNPLVGAKLFTYAAGSTTKLATYTTENGDVANENPIVLDSDGRPPYEVRFTAGTLYKLVLALSTDTDPPVSGVLLGDNLIGIGDTATILSQWTDSYLTPTYISATSFSVTGDQTSDFTSGRRLKITLGSSTVYGTITTSAFTTLTTVTVRLDSGSLDNSILSVALGIVTPTNTGIPTAPVFTSTRTSNTILLQSDSGTLIDGSGTYTQTFTAAATLGNGWHVIYQNTGGTITLNPNASELINGELTLVLYPGEIYHITCDGSAFTARLLNDTSDDNIIINGAMRTWIEYIPPYASAPNSAYAAEMWQYGVIGAAVHDINRSTSVPTVAQAGLLLPYSIELDCTTADAAIAAGDYTLLLTKVEGYKFSKIAQKKSVLSFWVYATKIGTYCVSILNGAADQSYVAEYTISTTNTWEYKVIQIDATPSSGTWDYTNGTGLRVYWTIAAGSTFQTATVDEWHAGNFMATANQVNGTDSVNNNFRLTGVVLNEGTTPKRYKLPDISKERYDCFRYFWKGLPVGAMAWSADAADRILGETVTWPVEMRDNPVVTESDVSGATYNNCTLEAAAVNTNKFGTRFNVRSNAAGYIAVFFSENEYFIANARL
jgi:hypothetical protein